LVINDIDCCGYGILPWTYNNMIHKTTTPVLISMPRSGSHYVGSFLRETYKGRGVTFPGGSELFSPDFVTRTTDVIELFEFIRNKSKMDIFTVFHSDHLSNNINIPARPKYETLFDWFKEFYDGYQICLLRRKNLWKTYISWLFHHSIKTAFLKGTESFSARDYETLDDVHPWHNIRGSQNNEIVKSTIQQISPKFVHREKLWQNFLRELRYFEEEIITYYVKGKYNHLNVRSWWLEDLDDEKLSEWYVPEERRFTKAGGINTFVMGEQIIPFDIKYETYFKKSELEKIKEKLDKVVDTEFKHYGYVVN